MILSGINIANRSYALYKYIKGIRKQKKAEIIHKKSPTNKSPAAAYARSILDRALADPTAPPKIHIQYIISARGRFKSSKKQIKSMEETLYKHGSRFFTKEKLSYLAATIRKLGSLNISVKGKEFKKRLISLAGRKQAVRLLKLYHFSDFYYRAYLRQLKELQSQGFNIGTIEINPYKGRHSAITSQVLTKTVYPQNFRGLLASEFNKLPEAQKIRLKQKGIEVRVKVDYFPLTAYGAYPKVFSSLKSNKYAAIIYQGHALDDKYFIKALDKSFPAPIRSKYKSLLFLNHCNSANLAAKFREKIYGAEQFLGTRATVFPSAKVSVAALSGIIHSGSVDRNQLNKITYAGNKSRPWVDTKKPIPTPPPQLLASAR
ncbi:MAG: hypothetical protein HQ564_06150 [Candidatus Saganbacteria bacterium]|nr:hypothetical protein [Candidatus Saganbacteria bacterium]